MVRLRFKRLGTKQKPHFRLVAIDRRSARDAREIEILGHMDPRKGPLSAVFNMERINYWISVGGQPSSRVASVLKALAAGAPAPPGRESAKGASR